MIRTCTAPLAAILLAIAATPAFAQDTRPGLAPSARVLPARPSESALPSRSGIVAPSAAVARAWAKESALESKRSTPVLFGLYASYGVLQGLDSYSTHRALQAGATEANPLMKGGVMKNAAFKLATGALTIGAVKLMEKKSKKAAVVTMIVLNTALAGVVMNNMKNARR